MRFASSLIEDFSWGCLKFDHFLVTAQYCVRFKVILQLYQGMELPLFLRFYLPNISKN